MKKAFTSISIRTRSCIEGQINSLERKKSIQVLKPKIDKAVEFIRTCDDFASKKASDNLEVLESISGTGFVVCDQNELGLYLLETGYVALFPVVWKKIQIFVKDGNLQSRGFQNLNSFLACFWNCTNECRQLGDELVKIGVINLIFETLQTADYKNTRIVGFIDSLVSILHNIIRLNNSHRSIYRSCNGVAILERFLDVTNMVLKTDALLVLAYIVEEQDNKDLGDRGVLGFLVGLLKSAINTRGHYAYVESGAYSAMELLDGLNQLAVNDDNKMIIEKAGAIPLMIRMLQKSFTDHEKQLAAEGLWNLSFVESIKEKFRQHGVVPALQGLVNSDNEDLRQVCASALCQIEGRAVSSGSNKPKQPPSYTEAVSQGASSQVKSPQIMISYQWDSQERALDIRNRMTEAGYQVWMDVTNIKGDILHSMAEGVENSEAILICITEKYKESRPCRSEATYAYRLGKTIIPLLFEADYRPDGWLGILQGMDLYYDVHSAQMMRDSLDKLCKDIDDQFGKSREEGENEMVAKQGENQATSKSSTKSDSITPSSSKTVTSSEWTTEDVREWFSSNNLSQLCEIFDFCDGNHLKELHLQLTQDPKNFKEEMKTDYQMNAKIYLQFSVALKKLFKA